MIKKLDQILGFILLNIFIIPLCLLMFFIEIFQENRPSVKEIVEDICTAASHLYIESWNDIWK